MIYSNSIVNLLEALEYHKEVPSKSSIIKVAAGSASFITGLATFGVAVSIMFSDPSSALSGPFILIGMIPTIIGTWLTISGMSDHRFARWNKLAKWLSPSISQIFAAAFSLLTVSAAVLFISGLVLIRPDSPFFLPFMIQIGALIAAMLTGCLLVSRGPVNIGIISNRRRFTALVRSAIFETIALASPFSIGVAVIITNDKSVGWIPVAISAVVILVGYYRFRIAQIGQVFRSITENLELVRKAAHIEIHTPTSQTGRLYSTRLTEAYRNLHIAMVSHPAYTQRSFTSYPLTVLCMVTHLRTFKTRSPEHIFKGADRIAKIRNIIRMPDEQFAIESREVFEGLIWLMDQSLTPGFHKIGSKQDLREVFRIPELDIF